MKKLPNMKKAIADQIILWIVLFTLFVSFLFFVIDYSNALKVKDNADAIADYTARMIALNKDDADIVQGLNENIKGDYIATISSDAITCVEDITTLNYQVIVNVYGTLSNGFLPVSNNNIHSKVAIFNESSEYEKECSITLSFN